MDSFSEDFQRAYEEVVVEDIIEINIKGFIEHCENLYGMSTEEFLKQYKENGMEGNPEQQLWALFARNLS